ncbi:hypothetical protein DLA51_13785 [Salmonella enterica]|uniref:Uncharacterized protein n=1 Tax=Salmonella phage STML-13-1 TaxID=1204530 RepID=K4I4H4_9CAUD|nr:hypothetical protein FDI91_gp108 [Salmonella phage STML-13-1]AFU64247.1 hypothetical protein [Salmonella phage STML-13-1]EBI9227117.1 hypothetical protein [Salmonella enterica]
MTPYVYRIKSKQGHFYYGCRYSKDCHPDDLWATYFTSSSLVKSLIEENGLEFFDTKIVMVCETPEDALRVEGLLISKTHKFPGCLNQFLCRKDGTPVHLGTYGTPSEKVRQKISSSNKGKKRTKETRERIKLGKTGTTWSEAQRNGVKAFQQTEAYQQLRNKINTTNKNRTKTPEELASISASLRGRKKPAGFGERVSATNKVRNSSLSIWQTNRAKPLQHVWAMADQFYQLWKNEGWGHERFCNRMNDGNNIRVFYNMYKMFKYENWVPMEDPEWVKDFM